MFETPTIVSLCDYSGVWSAPYAEAGYNVRRIDLERDGIDVRTLEALGPIHGLIAQPPCTHLASSGARWWQAKGEQALLEAMSIVDACLRVVVVSRPEWWVVENPVGRLSRYLGKASMTFNPCDYAGYADNPETEQYTKRTCLWGNFNHPAKRYLEPVHGSKMHTLPESKARARLRSLTPQGFARAFFQANH